MSDAQKTVYISYHRSLSGLMARAIFHDLRDNGYDVLMDLGEKYTPFIENQIAARSHLVLLLSLGFTDKHDVKRYEAEMALDEGRNITVLLLHDLKMTEADLTGKLTELRQANNLSLSYNNFEAVMYRLRNRYLKQGTYGLTPPVSDREQQHAQDIVAELVRQGKPTGTELQGEGFLTFGYRHMLRNNFASAEADFTETVRLVPYYADAFHLRGIARERQHDLAGAIQDYDEAARLNPHHDEIHASSVMAHKAWRDLNESIQRFNAALERNPDDFAAYQSRGNARYAQGDYEGAIQDYEAGLMLRPDHPALLEWRENALRRLNRR